MKLLDNVTTDTVSSEVSITKPVNTLSIKGSYGGGHLNLLVKADDSLDYTVAATLTSSDPQVHNVILSEGVKLKVELRGSRNSKLSVGFS